MNNSANFARFLASRFAKAIFISGMLFGRGIEWAVKISTRLYRAVTR
ncbi:hypothetical protein XNW1_2300003 [Xenorhabdus nematophila str. Websteri]|nr:hypothetical protein XNW1_1040003 [Xenorhabdus nematophila str. Websteri]CEF30199.1 hypothetical protein XNW1_2300003 [Xenorhabdus nematophila str. Websteri]